MNQVPFTLLADEPVFSWCPMCLTTSHYRVVVHVVSLEGMTPLGYAVGCVRCDADHEPLSAPEDIP
jgi:hypothetical protein